MGTVAPTNAGLTDLLKILSNVGSPLVSSTLSTPKMQAALASASPADIVKLSNAALQLQEAEGMFSSSGTSSSGSTGLQSLFSAMDSFSGSSGGGADSWSDSGSAQQTLASLGIFG